MTYGVTFTCHVRDHGTILTYKPASGEDATRLPSDPGMWITLFPSVESIEEALISVGLPTSIATNGEGCEVFDVTRAQLATLRFSCTNSGSDFSLPRRSWAGQNSSRLLSGGVAALTGRNSSWTVDPFDPVTV